MNSLTIKWNLPKAMFESGVFTPTELKKLIKEKVNFEISDPAMHRLVKGLPKECKFATIDVLCQALDCRIEDIIVYRKPTEANQCVQPLVLESTFKPPVKAKKQKKEEDIKISPPPI
jgi:DNA-binding Xre family transcriptional regulator